MQVERGAILPCCCPCITSIPPIDKPLNTARANPLPGYRDGTWELGDGGVGVTLVALVVGMRSCVSRMAKNGQEWSRISFYNVSYLLVSFDKTVVVHF